MTPDLSYDQEGKKKKRAKIINGMGGIRYIYGLYFGMKIIGR